MKTKTIDVGRVVGLSTYELAKKHGFIGTEEEFVDKESKVYDDMKDYADQSKVEMNRLIASATEAAQNTNLAEVIAARGGYDNLTERLSAGDAEISTILERLKTIDGGGDIITGSRIDTNGDLILMVKDRYDESPYGGIELRNTGSQIQWRSNGFIEWQPLVNLRDLMPKLTNVIVNALESSEEASGHIESTGDKQTLVLNIPKGEDGLNGGQILDAEVNEAGELILTVSNTDFTTVDSSGNTVPFPMLGIGEVKTVEYDQPASASITGTPTNPVLNLSIPRGKPTKIERAYMGEDGFLVFDSGEV